MSELVDMLLSGVGVVGNVLDTPGALVRNTLSGRNPFSGLNPFDSEGRASGRDMLESWGALEPNEEGLDWGDVAGFGAELVTDPLNFMGLGAARKTATAAREARAANAASDAMRAAGAIPEELVPRSIGDYRYSLGQGRVVPSNPLHESAAMPLSEWERIAGNVPGDENVSKFIPPSAEDARGAVEYLQALLRKHHEPYWDSEASTIERLRSMTHPEEGLPWNIPHVGERLHSVSSSLTDKGLDLSGMPSIGYFRDSLVPRSQFATEKLGRAAGVLDEGGSLGGSAARVGPDGYSGMLGEMIPAPRLGEEPWGWGDTLYPALQKSGYDAYVDDIGQSVPSIGWADPSLPFYPSSAGVAPVMRDVPSNRPLLAMLLGHNTLARGSQF